MTTADVAVLEGDERVAEIARMLGGDPESDVSRAHARELLELLENPPQASAPPPKRSPIGQSAPALGTQAVARGRRLSASREPLLLPFLRQNDTALM